MRCQNCGNELKANSAFCASCGSKVEMGQGPQNFQVPNNNMPNQNYYGGYQQPNKGNGFLIAIIIFLLLIIVGVGGYFGYKHFFGNKENTEEKQSQNESKKEKEKEKEDDNNTTSNNSKAYFNVGELKLYLPKSYIIKSDRQIERDNVIIDVRTSSGSINNIYLGRKIFVSELEKNGIKVIDFEKTTISDQEVLKIKIEVIGFKGYYLMSDINSNRYVSFTILSNNTSPVDSSILDDLAKSLNDAKNN